MNVKIKSLVKSISYTVSSNLISLIVSTLVVLIIPKLIGVEDYGYWQLYIFYSSYVGFLHFGWNDGIYLRYGGERYEDLNKNLFFSQFIELLISQLGIGAIVWFSAVYFGSNFERVFIIQMVAIDLIIVNTRLMLLYVLQFTNRIREYARITIFDRVIYIILILVFLAFGIRNYRVMVVADLIGKFISLIFAAYACKEIVFKKIDSFYLTISEAIVNINIGIKLMFANIAGMLIIGIVRFGIERVWDVATFGKVSLTLSISKMIMIFINAIGIIMYPLLRRTKPESLASIYMNLRDLLMALLLAVLLIYYPLKTVMVAWLPQYAESLLYMGLVFPMFIYEGKMALLINTYLKTLRREKVMLNINIITMLISLILTFISTSILMNLDLAILNIVILLSLRSILAERYLAKVLNIRIVKDILLEQMLTIVFIITAWFIDSWIIVLIYGIFYLIYIILKKNDFINTINNIKLLMKS